MNVHLSAFASFFGGTVFVNLIVSLPKGLYAPVPLATTVDTKKTHIIMKK
jgi:hypothetical protein